MFSATKPQNGMDWDGAGLPGGDLAVLQQQQGRDGLHAEALLQAG